MLAYEPIIEKVAKSMYETYFSTCFLRRKKK